VPRGLRRGKPRLYSLLITAAKLPPGQNRKSAPGTRAHPGCERESPRLRGRAPGKSHWQSCASGWKGTPPSPGLQRATGASAKFPAGAATAMAAGTIRLSLSRSHRDHDRHSYRNRRHGDRRGRTDTARARRIPGGTECVEAPRPSRQKRRATSVRQAPGEPPADRGPRSPAAVVRQSLPGEVQTPPLATLPAAWPELAACAMLRLTARVRVRRKDRPGGRSTIQFRRRIEGGRKWIG